MQNINCQDWFNLTFTVKIFCADEVSEAQRDLAAERFRAALEQVLSAANLVWPSYSAYLKLFQQYGDHSRPWSVTTAEQVLIDLWQAAELAATLAAFGNQRYLGDADFEILAQTV